MYISLAIYIHAVPKLNFKLNNNKNNNDYFIDNVLDVWCSSMCFIHNHVTYSSQQSLLVLYNYYPPLQVKETEHREVR